MNYRLTISIFVVGLFSEVVMAQKVPQLNENNIDEVIAAMTLEEKAQLLVGNGHEAFVGSGAMLGHNAKLVPGAAGQTAINSQKGYLLIVTEFCNFLP